MVQDGHWCNASPRRTWDEPINPERMTMTQNALTAAGPVRPFRPSDALVLGDTLVLRGDGGTASVAVGARLEDSCGNRQAASFETCPKN